MHGKAEDTRGNGQRNEDDPLQSAIDHLAGDARTTGEESFRLRQSAAIRQREALVRWAEGRGLMLCPALWEGRTVIGGSEHDLWEEPGEYWKVTRPDHFGWTVLPGRNGMPRASEATPLEYLERWANAIRYFGDQVRLRGVASTEQGVQVVISQTHISGPYPANRTIVRDLGSRSFKPVPRFSIGAERDSSFYHPGERVAIFDAATDNFILSQGVPIPVDVVTLVPGEKLHRQLSALVAGR